MDYLIKLHAFEPKAEELGGESGLSLGLRAGYCFTPYNADWKILDGKASNGSEIGVDGPFVHLTVGWGIKFVK